LGILWRSVVILAVAAGMAAAHEREFTLSRDWFLPYQGEFELESRSFYKPKPKLFTQEFELEYGVTEWFAVEPGIEFEKPNGDGFEAKALEMELRFNLGSFAFDRILPALNVEFEHALQDEEEREADAEESGEEEEEGDNHLEAKLILSWYREDGQDFAINLNGGISLGSEHETGGEFTAGYVRPLLGDESPSPGWHHGLRGGVEFIEEFKENHARLGPLLVYRATEHLNLLANYSIALNQRDENFDEFRLIAEWEF
jgi:hypothetical protein